MRAYSFSTQDVNGNPLNIAFGVEATIKDPSKPMFLKIDSGTYTPMFYYISRLHSVVITPFSPGDSSFNIVAGAITYTFSRDEEGWKVEYQAAGPIFISDPLPLTPKPPSAEEIAAASNRPLPWQVFPPLNSE